ncbi:head closure Hc2 [Vibrio phage K469]
MATNKYFNNQKNTAQHNLAESLIIQAIQHRGIDVKFIPATTIDNDDVFNETLKTKFSILSDIEMYVQDVTNYNGDGDIYQAFGGFTMTDNMTLIVSQKRFKEEASKTEPEEGDLIYIPYANLMFQVDKLLEDEDFRQWGKNYVYRIRATKYAYGHEELATGDMDIDSIMDLDLSVETVGGDEIIIPNPASVNNVNQHAQDEAEPFNLDFGDK